MPFAVTNGFSQAYKGLFSQMNDAHSARMMALGGIILPMHDGDLQTITFNPSSICPAMDNQIALSYVGDFKMGTNYASVQYSHTFDKLGSFGATVQYDNYGAFEYASESGHVDGTTFNVSDYVVTLGWGRELTDKWSIGANLKYAGIQYETSRGGALGVDVAATYWAYSNWAFTLAGRNIGHQLFYTGTANEEKWLPFSLDFTASKKLDHLPLTIVMGYHDIQKWKVVSDNQYLIEENYDPITGQYTQTSNTKKFFNNLGSHLVLGGELEIGKNFLLRASYNYESHLKMDVPKKRTLVGFSAGFGLKIKAFQIDYAYSRNNIVGSPHFLSLRMDLNKF
jgi:hypothetical protein